MRNLTKTFASGERSVEVLKNVNLDVEAGESVAILGPSGTGKSTLLHILGTLDAPTSGTVLIDGQDPFDLSEPDLARFRNDRVGFIFQDHHLLPQYTVLDNVLIPSLPFSRGDQGARERGLELIERVGLSHRLDHRPAQLSGGERQRVAVARALINGPRLLLCDEPTGSLDHRNAEAIGTLLMEMHQKEGNLLLTVTHSLELAGTYARRLELREGTCFEA